MNGRYASRVSREIPRYEMPPKFRIPSVRNFYEVPPEFCISYYEFRKIRITAEFVYGKMDTYARLLGGSSPETWSSR